MELIGRRLPGAELKAVLDDPETVDRTASDNGQTVLLMIS